MQIWLYKKVSIRCRFNICEQVVVLPLTRPKSPARYYPQTQYKDEEDVAGADRHEGLQDEARVEADPIERADAPGGGVREELAVEEHHPTDEVKTEEHRHWEGDVQRYHHLLDPAALGRVNSRPREVDVDRYRVHGADYELYAELDDSTEAHRNAPVFDAVVDFE